MGALLIVGKIVSGLLPVFNLLIAFLVFVTYLVLQGVTLASVSLGVVIGIVVFTALVLLFESVSILDFRRPQKISWFSFPELDRLAAKMQMPSSQGSLYGIYDGVGPTAYVDGLRKKVAFKRKALTKLSKGESTALAAHEFAHLKGKHAQTRFIVSVSFLLAAGFAVYWGLPLAAVLVATSMFLALGILGRRQEYSADCEAARFTSPEDMIGCIEALANLNKRGTNLSSDRSLAVRLQRHLFSHPSLENRIQRIQSLKETAGE